MSNERSTTKSRVELRIQATGDSSRLRIVETRPLELLDLVGVPLPGPGGATFGPAPGGVNAPRPDERRHAGGLARDANERARNADERVGAVFEALSDPTRRALPAAIAEHPASTASELA